MAAEGDAVVDARELFRERRLQAEADENGFSLEVYRRIVERLGEQDADDDHAADE